MKNLKLITIFLLLASMILSVTACTISEESKAETSGEVSSETSTGESKEESADVSETVSAAVSETVSAAVSETESKTESEVSNDVSEAESEVESEVSETEISEDKTIEKFPSDKLRLMLSNGETETLDTYKDGKILCAVEILVLPEELEKEIKKEYGYSAKEYVLTEEGRLKMMKDLGPLLGKLRPEIVRSFYEKFSIPEGDFYMKDEYIYDYPDLVVISNLEEILIYDIYFPIYLTEEEMNRVTYSETDTIYYQALPLWKIFDWSTYYEVYLCRMKGTPD